MSDPPHIREVDQRMYEIKPAKSLPPIRRGGGRTSKDREVILKALRTYEPRMIEGIRYGKQYNALQQKIRSTARNADISVTITFQREDEDSEEGTVYFQGIAPVEVIDQEDLAKA